MTQQVHPVLGISRPDGEWPKRCSKCTTELLEDDTPLMLFGPVIDGHQTMWVYCEQCEEPIWPLLAEAKAARKT